ncbi:MAG: hypothetical protein R6V23_02630 [Bacteroidales bacterium]
MNRFILLVFMILIPVGVFSQETKSDIIDKDKENYEENIFNKAFEKINDSLKKQNRYDYIPEKLPEWCLQVINADFPFEIIGISDPGMEWSDAKKQAELRAIALLALMNSCSVSNITDDYTNLNEGNGYALYATKFQDFARSQSRITYNDSQVEVVDTFFTKYNEAIVKIRFNYQSDATNNTDTLDVKGEHLQVFVERNFKRDKLEFFNLTIDNKRSSDSSAISLQYNFKQAYGGFDISSVFGKDTIDFVPRTYNYRTNQEFTKDSTDSELKYFRLNKGLWNAQMVGVLSNITWIAKHLSSAVKNSNDFYTLKNQGLIRTVSRSTVALDIQSLKIVENNLYLDLTGKIKQ